MAEQLEEKAQHYSWEDKRGRKSVNQETESLHDNSFLKKNFNIRTENSEQNEGRVL